MGGRKWQKLATDPVGTVGRGIDNTLETGGTIWTEFLNHVKKP
jgi:hypothetical protein